MIEEWKRLARQEPDSRLRADYAGLASVFGELTRHAENWHQALKDWNMSESQVVLEWQLTRARADLLRVLQLRFVKEVPADLKVAIERMTDPDVISRWFAAAVTAPSLDAFREAVQD